MHQRVSLLRTIVCIAGHCRALQGIAGHYRALQGIAGQYRALQGTTEHCRALQGIAGHCRALQGTFTYSHYNMFHNISIISKEYSTLRNHDCIMIICAWVIIFYLSSINIYISYMFI